VDAIRRCQEPVDALTLAATDAPDTLAAGPARRRAGALARRLGSVRRAIAGRPEPTDAVPAQSSIPATGDPGPLDAAFDTLASAVDVLSAVFPPLPVQAELSARTPETPAGAPEAALAARPAPAAPASGMPGSLGASSSAD